MRGRLAGRCIAAALLLAVSGRAAEDGAAPKRVLCTTFPMYQVTRHVAHGSPGVAVELMLSAELGCPHDYALTPADMRKVLAADVMVMNGLGMESFLDAAIRKAGPALRVIDTSRGLQGLLKFQEEEGETDEDHGAYNPHLFASPRMLAGIARNVARGLAEADPAGAALYAQNADSYADTLNRLADDLAAAGRGLKNRKIVAQHSVLDYFARDAGLEVVAVVQDHPGQEPSAAEMLGIIRRIRASGAGAVFTEPQYPAGVGETIAREAGVPVAVLDPVASGPADAGLDYYEKIMRANIEMLIRTLGGS